MPKPPNRDIYGVLARLLTYPSENYVNLVNSIALGCSTSRASASIERFAQAFDQKSQGECEELYTQTFDLSPPCTPNVSAHLFGEESFKRAALMAKLREHFNQVGLDAGSELPDHIATLLKFMEFGPEEMRIDMDRHVIRPALEKMCGILGRIKNPYAHLLEAAIIILRTEFGREIAHA